MPYKIRKVRNQNCYMVVAQDGEKKSKCTTKDKAQRQINLLNAVEHSDWRPNKNYYGGMIEDSKNLEDIQILLKQMSEMIKNQ